MKNPGSSSPRLLLQRAVRNASLASLFLASAVEAHPLQAAPFPLTERLVPTDGSSGDDFGWSVAVDGTRVLVGAPEHENVGSDTGAVYVFDSSTGSELDTIVPDATMPGDRFGSVVATSDARAVIVADPTPSSTASAAYLVDLVTGLRIAELVPSGNDAGFGVSVAMDGDLVVVGADLSSSAYLFDATTGSEITRLFATDGPAQSRFGFSVSIHGSIVAVGAPDVSDTTPGAAYLFDATTGVQLAKLVADDGDPGDRFGESVDIDGDRVLVGAPYRNPNPGPILPPYPQIGAAYLFDAATGVQLRLLSACDPTNFFGRFGSSVALRGSVAAIRNGGGGEGTGRFNGLCLFDVRSGDAIGEYVAGAGSWLTPAFGALDLGTEVTVFSRDDGVYLLRELPRVDFRNGGTNPASYEAGLGTRGNDLRFTVDTSTTGHTHALVLGFDSPVELTLGAGQTLLGLSLLGSGEIFNTGFVEGPLATIDLAVPDAPQLVGLEVFTQAVHAFGATPFALSNAQDLKIGGCPRVDEWSHKIEAAPDGSDLIFFTQAFGTAVALDDTTGLVGSPGQIYPSNLIYGFPPGKVFLVDATSGSKTELISSESDYGDQFGFSAAIDGNVALVGAPADSLPVILPSNPTAAAIAFDPRTGEELARFEPDDPLSRGFGFAVDVSGTTALIGSPEEGSCGVMYLFDLTTGSRLHRIEPMPCSTDSAFGTSVAIHGTTALGGAPNEGNGRVLVHETAGGALLFDLGAEDGGPGDQFGWSLALDGNIAVIGAPGDDDRGLDSGAAYLFDVSTGTQLAKLLPSEALAGDRFGGSVAIHGTTVLVGSIGNFGSVIEFDATSGLQTRKLDAGCDGMAFSSFGGAVALSATHVLVGAHADNSTGLGDGSAFVFDRTDL